MKKAQCSHSDLLSSQVFRDAIRKSGIYLQVDRDQSASKNHSFAVAGRLKGGKPCVQHHFPLFPNYNFIGASKCRQFSVLGLTRGSLGSFYTTIVRRPLDP
jgi:hypothetical protein